MTSLLHPREHLKRADRVFTSHKVRAARTGKLKRLIAIAEIQEMTS